MRQSLCLTGVNIVFRLFSGEEMLEIRSGTLHLPQAQNLEV